ncbi:hypothetical protein ET282_13135, partial [Salmonella enterica]|nr:hypothetical protein [Salmonella enterica]
VSPHYLTPRPTCNDKDPDKVRIEWLLVKISKPSQKVSHLLDNIDYYGCRHSDEALVEGYINQISSI